MNSPLSMRKTQNTTIEEVVAFDVEESWEEVGCMLEFKLFDEVKKRCFVSFWED